MLRDFIAIDFETANQEPSSVCSVGAVLVRDAQVVDSFYSLIQPEPNYYSYFCQRVHGLSQQDTDDAPIFPRVWQLLGERVADVFFPDLPSAPYDPSSCSSRWATEELLWPPLVAHNARFDEGCLKAVFRVYQMDYPDYPFFCTCVASRRAFPQLPNHQLHTVSEYCGYHLANHHHALADAEACAWIAREIL